MSNLLYDALMLGRNKKVEYEEFQIAGGKQPAAFSAAEQNIEISNVVSDSEYSIQLYQDCPGYFEIEVLCNDNFIVFDRKVITSDEFNGGKYQFRFMIISDRLHNGRNFSAITFVSARQKIEIPVVVDNRIRVKLTEVNPRSRIIELEKLYVDLHMGNISSRTWAEKSLELLSDDNISGDDELSLKLMLFKAQAYMTINDDVHARNYIEYVGTQIPKLDNRSYNLYCYFIYLVSIYELDGIKNSGTVLNPWTLSDSSEGIVPFSAEHFSSHNIMDMTYLQKARWTYFYHPAWDILNMLIYMDPYFRIDKRFTFEEMHRLFYKEGEISRVMYMEALKLMELNVEKVMTEPDPFTVQVLNFAVKYGKLTQEMAERFASLLYQDGVIVCDRSLRGIATGLLRAAYEKYPEKSILEVILKILKEADCREADCHKYFERAVKEGITDSWVFDYYIYTLDKKNPVPVPEQIMRYFIDHTEYLYDYREYFYANLITNSYSYGSLYEENLTSVIKFAEYQMLQGQPSELMYVIYLDILKNDRLTDVMKSGLYEVLCTKKVTCRNDRMTSVLVFHKELQVYQESILKNGCAFIKIYTPDALILFKDKTGNVFRKIDFSIDQMINEREYIDVCIKDASINKYMLMGDTLPLLRAYKPPTEILEFFSSRKIVGQFRKSYEQELLQNTISYYAKNSKDEKVYDELIKMRQFDLSAKTRSVLVGRMLKRGLVDDAFEEVCRNGLCDLSREQMADLASQYIRLHGTERNDVLTVLCEAGFGVDTTNQDIFDYLYLHYNGDIILLTDIYRACGYFCRPVRDIEERILARSMETGEHPEIVPTVFRRYYEADGDRGYIERYIRFRAERYLYLLMTGVEDRSFSSDMSFFDFMENDMLHGIVFSDECAIALLLYRTGSSDMNGRQLKNLENLIKDLVSRGKMLEEFRYYSKYFDLPSTLVNNIIISAFSEEPGVKPRISYEITGPSETMKGEEDMEEIFRNCYVKYFTLFYGEKVVFSMDEKKSSVIRYSDRPVVHDGSRYAELDEMIKRCEQNDRDGYYKAIKDFYIKERLIDRLI